MADNVSIVAGGGSPTVGEVVATDSIGGAQYQRIKLVKGADGVNDGDISDSNPLPVSDSDAANTYGEQAGVPSGNTVTLVSYAAAAAWKFTGFIADGEADGRYFVQFDAVTKYQRRTNIAQRQAELILPNPDAAAGGTTVTLKVENVGEVAADFEGTLLGV